MTEIVEALRAIVAEERRIIKLMIEAGIPAPRATLFLHHSGGHASVVLRSSVSAFMNRTRRSESAIVPLIGADLPSVIAAAGAWAQATKGRRR